MVNTKALWFELKDLVGRIKTGLFRRSDLRDSILSVLDNYPPVKFDTLPQDMQINILSFLNQEELNNIKLVSKMWSKLGNKVLEKYSKQPGFFVLVNLVDFRSFIGMPKVDKKTILSAFPTDQKIKLFTTLKYAIDYADLFSEKKLTKVVFFKVQISPEAKCAIKEIHQKPIRLTPEDILYKQQLPGIMYMNENDQAATNRYLEVNRGAICKITDAKFKGCHYQLDADQESIKSAVKLSQ